MISQTGRYALRILGYLGEHEEQWVLGRDIATATRIPANYLGKILNRLRKAGYVRSQKGWGGGFMLDKASRAVPIGEVVELFEGKKDSTGCVFELRRCNAKHPCPLHEPWQRVQEQYQRMLDSVEISDLAGEAAK